MKSTPSSPNRTFTFCGKQSLVLHFKFSVLILIFFQFQAKSQESNFIRSPWWIGTAAGINYNIFDGSISKFNSEISTSVSFNNTKEKGLFAYPVIEFHKSDAAWGFMLHAGYESRRGIFNQLFYTKLAYITIEPSLRLNLFHSPFYLYSGPRIAFNVDRRFVHKQTADGPEAVRVLSDMRQIVSSFQVGAGYDLYLTSPKRKAQVILSPFVAFHPSIGQEPRTIDSWNLTTFRGGIAFKFGMGGNLKHVESLTIPVYIKTEKDDNLLINKTLDPSEKRKVSEVLPLWKYVYFDLLPKSDQNRTLVRKKIEINPISGNYPTLVCEQQIAKEQNFLSQLADQMIKDPTSGITLIYSSKKDKKGGLQFAEAVKMFLTGVLGMPSDKIEILRQKSITKENILQNQLLKELQHNDTHLKIVTHSDIIQKAFREIDQNQDQVLMINEVSEDSQLSVKSEGKNDAFSFWSVEIKDNKGKIQNFGPFQCESVSMSTKDLLESRSVENFDLTMIGQLKEGKTLKSDTTLHLTRWTPPTAQKNLRFSITYQYNNSKAVKVFRQYLADFVVSKIPANGSVVIHGHGENNLGEDLDLRNYIVQENDVREIIEQELRKSGRDDVKLEFPGIGEDQTFAPFKSKKQDHDFYNRTVIIDISGK